MTTAYDWVIFDLDGTLANIEHRLKYIKSNRSMFNSECIKDAPIHQTIITLKMAATCGMAIEIWTGREELTMDLTIQWLKKYGVWKYIKELKMRQTNDRRHDHIIKNEWYQNLPPIRKSRLLGVYEDRQSVVDMWRGIGVQCYQVAPGNF
jgi:FMN phosphatase YigB (HAD superfamily)